MTDSAATTPPVAERSLARHVTRVRRVRMAATVGAGLCVVAFLVGAYKSRIIVFADRASIGIGRGCVSFGLHRELPASWNARVSRPLLGPIGVFNYDAVLDGSSWRPYHAAGWSAHHIVIPLWQPLAVLSLVAGLAHGYLRGLRWRDARTCLGCKHEIVPRAGLSRCPECGLEQRTSDMPRMM